MLRMLLSITLLLNSNLAFAKKKPFYVCKNDKRIIYTDKFCKQNENDKLIKVKLKKLQMISNFNPNKR